LTAINRPFVGIPSFLRAPVSAEPEALARAAVAVLGVPFDEGSPFLPGSRMGPRAIREHTLRFPPEGLYDVDTGRSFLEHELANRLVLDAGDVDVRPANPARTFELITERVRAIVAAGAFPVVLGGDHSITWPVFQGLGRPAHVVQFDAHQDVSHVDAELQRTNSHAFRHIIGMGECLSLTQVGIRGWRNPRAHVEEIRALGHRVVGMRETRMIGAQGIAALLPEDAPVFVSIDVDALDMSIVPGCVSAEPDGLAYAELMEALEAIAVRCDVVGFDFVEVNPPLDIATGATAYLGAVVVCGFLGYMAAQPRWRARLAARNLIA
jgi:agmatinase